jgi:hypothetical protein
MQVRATENTEEFGKCGCGRSPSGKCIGWHALTEQEWIEGKTQLIHNFNAGRVVNHITEVDSEGGEV